MGSSRKKQAFFDILKRLETTKEGNPTSDCLLSLFVSANSRAFLCRLRPNLIRTSALPKSLFCLFTFRFAPVGAQHALVAAVAPFGVVFGGFEEVGGFGRELFHH